MVMIGLSGKMMAAVDHAPPMRELPPAATEGRGAIARAHWLAPSLAGIVGAGLLLRLWCAEGPLWLDEIWSIENLAPLTHFWQVFWGISSDNNHFLNSLWLYFATGLTGDEAILRAPSIALGVLAIAMMARLGARQSPAAAIAAAAMTALSYFFVNYSVEARGYAGGALALAIGLEALERAIARPLSQARFALAAALGIGLLWQLAILPAIAAFALIALLEARRIDGQWKPAFAAAIHIFTPVMIAMTPALGFVIAGAFVVGSITLGGVRAFDAGQTLGAIAEMARDAIGLPAALPAWAVVAGCVAAILFGLAGRLVLAERKIAYAIILLAAPAIVFVLRPPNAHIPRYYLVCAMFLILLLAELFGGLWRAGGWRRWIGLAALAAILAGDADLVLRFQASKADAWPRALAAIADSGQTRLASNFDERVGRFVAYYNRTHPPLDLVAGADWGVRRPQWFIAETAGIADLPPALDLRRGDVEVSFDLVRRYETWGLSRVGWALYRAR